MVSPCRISPDGGERGTYFFPLFLIPQGQDRVKDCVFFYLFFRLLPLADISVCFFFYTGERRIFPFSPNPFSKTRTNKKYIPAHHPIPDRPFTAVGELEHLFFIYPLLASGEWFFVLFLSLQLRPFLTSLRHSRVIFLQPKKNIIFL